MHRIFRALAPGLLVLIVTACSHTDEHAPLAYAPADTPYLVANLKPLNADVRNALLEQADAQLPSQLAQLRQIADQMAREGDTAMAGLMRALAAEFDGRRVQDTINRIGLDVNGLSALYGVGMSPVARFTLSDTKAFQAFVTRLENGYGKPLPAATLDKLHYRHTEPAPDAPFQFVLSIQGKQAIAALLPAHADASLLRRALGLTRPDKSAQDAGRLEELAKAHGYTSDVVGYLDLTRIPPLIAGGRDPLVKALLANDTGKREAIPARCQPELERMAARVPMLSFGYTTLTAERFDQRLDVQLAPDIVQAFAGIKSMLPGLGGTLTAPFDLALALPMDQIRRFWIAQADAVAAKPFTCPALRDLNTDFVKLRALMQKAVLPPFGDLRGVHTVIDKIETTGKNSGIPKFAGRALVASSNPASLLAIARASMPVLASVQPGHDGKPVALPDKLSATLGSKVWVAMTDKALAVAVGDGERDRLDHMLKADTGSEGSLFKAHISGEIYRQWLDFSTRSALASMTAATKANAGNQAMVEQMRRNMAVARKQAERIEAMDFDVHMSADGLTMQNQTRLKH